MKTVNMTYNLHKKDAAGVKRGVWLRGIVLFYNKCPVKTVCHPSACTSQHQNKCRQKALLCLEEFLKPMKVSLIKREITVARKHERERERERTIIIFLCKVGLNIIIYASSVKQDNPNMYIVINYY